MKNLGLLFLIFFSLNAFALPQVTFVTDDQYVSESDGLVTVTATLDSPATALATVPFTVSGTANPSNDHDLKDNIFVFAAGTTKSTVTFRVFTDVRNEGDETIILNLQSAVNADLGVEITHTVFLLNNNGVILPNISFAAVSQSANEGDVANVVVNLSEASNQIITVSFSVTGTSDTADHNLVDSVVTFFPGQTSAIMSINLIDDGVVEGDETIEIQLLSPIINGAPGINMQHTLTISDSSTAPNVIPALFSGEWKRSNIGTGTCEENHEANDDGLQDDSQAAGAIFDSGYMNYFWRKFIGNTTCTGYRYTQDSMIMQANVLNATTTTFEAIFTIIDFFRIAQSNAHEDLNNYNAGAGACAKNDWVSGLTYGHQSNNMPWLPDCISAEGINAFTFSNIGIGFSVHVRASTDGVTALLEETADGGVTWTTWATFVK